MPNRTITLIIFSLILAIFIAYFAAQAIVFNSGNLVTGLLGQISQATQQGQWEKAEKLTAKLEEIWNKRKYLLTVNYAEMDYYLFEDNLGRLKSAIKEKDTVEADMQISAEQALWENFLKFVPAP